MNRQQVIGLSVLVALLLSLFLGGCQSGPTAEEIVARVREVEASTEDAHAVVEFNVQAQVMDMELVVELWEKKPNKFRAQVLEAGEADFAGVVSVTDGQQVWMYHPAQNEVVMGKPGDLGVDEPFDPSQIIQSMEEAIQWVLDNCEVKLVGEEDVDDAATYKLEFTPKEDEQTILPADSKVTLWVEQDRWIVLQAHFSGGALGEGRIHVRSFEFNMGLADELFQFEIPEGAQVINIEDMQPQSLTLDEARAQAEFTLLVPTYLPEDATLIDVFTVDGALVLYYDHSTTSFTIMQGLLQTVEEHTIGPAAEVTVRGQKASQITDGLGNSFLTWMEDGIVITIAGRISQEEILKVAESLQ